MSCRRCVPSRDVRRVLTRAVSALALVLGVLALPGCGADDSAQAEVVLYTSLNEPTARSVLDVFEAETGISVVLVADTERDKTVGLVRTLIEEASRPRADVFWNSETAQTERLKDAGVLERLDPPPASADNIPAAFRDPEGYWFGFAARARVLIVNTELVPADEFPTSVWDLVDPKWRGRTGIVRPVTGTTLTHVTALYEVLGEGETNRFLDAVLQNACHLPPGNGRLAQLVGQGEMHFGLTDSSDARLVADEGFPVTMVYPDQDGMGTLLIPNTVSRIAGGPNPAAARTLIEFLLSARAEEILAHHPRGHIPLQLGVGHPAHVRLATDMKTMNVDFGAVGRRVEQRLQELDRRFR